MKIWFMILVVHSALALPTTKATAQASIKDHNNKQTSGFWAVALKKSFLKSSIHSEVISERISKKFAQQFAGATNAVWAQTDEGFTVRFTWKGIRSRADLTKSGQLQSMFRYYTQEQIPADVRYLVDKKYEHFKTASAIEVQYNGATAYLVTIADETTWKVIRVIDGETEVWKAYSKG
jgi:hypothetical protein